MLAKRRGLNWNLRPPHNCCNCTFDSSCKFYDINVCRCDNFGNGGHDAKQKSQKARPKAGSVGIESIWIRWLWRAIWISFWINTFPSIHSIHLHMEAAKSVNIQRWKKGLILRCAPPSFEYRLIMYTKLTCWWVKRRRHSTIQSSGNRHTRRNILIFIRRHRRAKVWRD